MSEIIQIEGRPVLTVETYKGVVHLNQPYEFKLEKKMNGEVSYQCFIENQQSLSQELVNIITATIKNYAEKHGIGKSV